MQFSHGALLILGATRDGKSTFIAQAVAQDGQTRPDIASDDLVSHTKTHTAFRLAGLTVVDTVGFMDTDGDYDEAMGNMLAEIKNDKDTLLHTVLVLITKLDE